MGSVPHRSLFSLNSAVMADKRDTIFPSNVPINAMSSVTSDRSNLSCLLQIGLFASFTHLGSIHMVTRGKRRRRLRLRGRMGAAGWRN